MIRRRLTVAIVLVAGVLDLLTRPILIVHDGRVTYSRRLIMVVILDGLRPDSINQGETPNLYRLRSEGINYTNAHSVIPTVTRVNAGALATGHYPTSTIPWPT